MLDITTIDGFEVAFRRNSVDEKVLSRSFSKDRFFKEVPEYNPSATDVIIDVGAHIGTFALLASTKAPKGQIFAIEACRESANLCKINAALNGASNIRVAHLALSDQRGQAPLHYGKANWGHSLVTSAGARGKEYVRTDTLHNFLEDNGIVRCDFMKLNCEGAEFPIILKTERVVLRRVLIFLILYHVDLYPHQSKDDLLAQLMASGFRVSARHQRKGRGWIVAIRE